MMKSKQKSRPNFYPEFTEGKSPARLWPNDDFSNKVGFYVAEAFDKHSCKKVDLSMPIIQFRPHRKKPRPFIEKSIIWPPACSRQVHRQPTPAIWPGQRTGLSTYCSQAPRNTDFVGKEMKTVLPKHWLFELALSQTIQLLYKLKCYWETKIFIP